MSDVIRREDALRVAERYVAKAQEGQIQAETILHHAACANQCKAAAEIENALRALPADPLAQAERELAQAVDACEELRVFAGLMEPDHAANLPHAHIGETALEILPLQKLAEEWRLAALARYRAVREDTSGSRGGGA